MNRSKAAALILSPSLAMAGLLAAYWVEKRDPETRDAPLELHTIAPRQGLNSPMAAMDPSASAAIANASQAVDAPRLNMSPAEPSPSQTASLANDRPAKPAVAPPKFDVVRVEPSGDTLIAGHTEPNVPVAIVADGKVIGGGKSDATGQFVIMPPPLPPGEHGLSLRITPPSGAPVMSDQNVAVSVPVKGQHDVMVALAEPGKATVLLTDPTAQTPATVPAKPADAKKPASAAEKPDVAVKTAEVVEPGGFFATGIASPGSHLHIYLNDSLLADVTADSDGHWTIKVGKGLVPGHYAVRADQTDASGSIVARAEVPFDYKPVTLPKEADAARVQTALPAAKAPLKDSQKPAETPPQETVSAIAADASQPQQAGTTTIAEIQTATVEKGNSLWRISRGRLGVGNRYTEIYAANVSQIRDPKLIYPGQVFVIPQ